MSKKKKLFLCLFCFVALIAGLVVVALMNGRETNSTEYHESDRVDYVVYNGKQYQYNEHLSNYLFMGIDTTEPIDTHEVSVGAGQADAIYFISYHRVKKTIVCWAIPRDTMTNIRTMSVDGVDLGLSKDHINIQYAFGDGKEESCKLMKEAVSNLLYGMPIQGYCAVNMDAIPAAVETLGGVELTVPDDSLEHINTKFIKGSKVTVTETDAEQFVRYRDITQAQSAIVRMNRQKVFMEAFAETAKKKATNDVKFVVDMYESVEPYMVTNMSADLFAQLLDATYGSVEKIQDIPGDKVEGTDYDEYHVDETKLYELILQYFYEEVQED